MLPSSRKTSSMISLWSCTRNYSISSESESSRGFYRWRWASMRWWSSLIILRMVVMRRLMSFALARWGELLSRKSFSQRLGRTYSCLGCLGVAVGMSLRGYLAILMLQCLILLFHEVYLAKGLSLTQTSMPASRRRGCSLEWLLMRLLERSRYLSWEQGMRKLRVPWRLLWERSSSERRGSRGKFQRLRRSQRVSTISLSLVYFSSRDWALKGMILKFRLVMTMNSLL